MVSSKSSQAALFVDKASPQSWIVRDPDGNFWSVPLADNAWESRQPFEVTDSTDLQAIPGHYRYTLGLPF
jgi:hypothetical protein